MGCWECTSNDGCQESEAAPTPYCALDTGPLDAAAGAVGLVVRCTTANPTCTPPSPGQSAGWQCCRTSSTGGVREITCMASDASATPCSTTPPVPIRTAVPNPLRPTNRDRVQTPEATEASLCALLLASYTSKRRALRPSTDTDAPEESPGSGEDVHIVGNR